MTESPRHLSTQKSTRGRVPHGHDPYKQNTGHPAPSRHLTSVFVCIAVVAAFVLASCSGNENVNDNSTSTSKPVEITLITHDSFALSDSVLEEFTRQTGIVVEVMQGGDAVEIVNQAILTKGNPQGAVLFGVDNNLLTRALDEDLFEPYRSPGLDRVDQKFQLDPENHVTPIDFGDVCINADRSWFAAHNVAIPQTLDDLTKPAYKGLLVVQDPAASTPGLAFMLATIAQFNPDNSDKTAGDDTVGDASGSTSDDAPSKAWLDYWKLLKDNDVAVTSGWEQAYYERFSGGSGTGDRPLVVSYATSPVAEVEDPSTPPEDAPTEAIASTCFRQIEFAGILAGTKNVEAARQLIDFMLSTTFQNDIPAQMYVEPVVDDATVPEAFTKFAAVVDNPLTLSPDTISANRNQWVSDWSRAMGR